MVCALDLGTQYYLDHIYLPTGSLVKGEEHLRAEQIASFEHPFISDL